MSKSVTRLPGKKEAKEILEDYATAMNGTFAWVRVGLRLWDVKSRIPHGDFTKWVDANLQRDATLKKRHLYSAKRVAADLMLYVNELNMREAPYTFKEALKMLDDPTGQLALIVAGKSQRQLMIETRDLLESNDEAAAQLWCEQKWSKDSEARDEWEPRVLDGSESYTTAKMGMMGVEHTAGKPRPDTKHTAHLFKAVGSLKRHWDGWGKMGAEEQSDFVSDLCESLAAAPDSVKKAMIKNLTT